jgi:competence protein ComGF
MNSQQDQTKETQVSFNKMRRESGQARPADFASELDKVRDQLTRVNIYFIKENHDDPMYQTWGDAGKMAQVNQHLAEIMSILQIDPEATAY